MSDISESLNRGKIATAIFVDVQCAFDTIWHAALIYKMKQYDLSLCLIKIILNFLKNRKFVVGRGVNRSNSFKIDNGVPQGSVLGPKLFNLYLADLPTHDAIKSLQFADDIVFYLSHTAPAISSFIINNFLNLIHNYYTEWKLVINENKTNVINFYGSNKAISKKLIKRNKDQQQIKMHNVDLLAVNSIKYLGVVFNSNFKFINHVDHICKRANMVYSQLTNVIKSNFIESRLKLYIYKVYIRSILQYASMSWLIPTHISSHQVEKIRLLERKILRKATNIRRPRGTYKHISNLKLYQTANVRRIDNVLLDNAIRFFNKCNDSENEFIRGLIEPFRENKYYKPSYIYHLNINNELQINNKIYIFHKGHNNPHTIVYNVSQ